MTENTSAAKLSALRRQLASLGADGMFVSTGDEFLGEYVPPSACRLEWLTGFSGSAGAALVLAGKAAFFTDGRYTLQAQRELAGSEFSVHNSADLSPEEWLVAHAAGRRVLALDPRLHSDSALQKFRRKNPQLEFLMLEQNPIDVLWHDRPLPPASRVLVHGVGYSGATIEQKCTQVAQQLQKTGADAALLVLSDSVNWLLNLRAADLEFSPLLLAYAIIRADGSVRLYADAARFDEEVVKHLGSRVSLCPPAALESDLSKLAGQNVLLDSENTPVWFVHKVEQAGARVVKGQDPCLLLKSRKNAVEREGVRQAHARDGLAVTRFLHWLSRHESDGPDEVAIAEKLIEFRSLSPLFWGASFATIAGFGANGAIVHYRASPETASVIKADNLLLVDSGGQYPDGTTDITRTVAIGSPGVEHRQRYTQVLKGHMALARVMFPAGTTGSQLDVLARLPLWQHGLDYDHGTGHGVGYFMNVHEGPQRISKRGNNVALEEGMILSNEPGYYKAGDYGIRIENLVMVVACETSQAPDGWLRFETLTLVPFDRRLIDASLLNTEEKNWLNAYHSRVLATHLPQLEPMEASWLQAICEPL